MKFKTSQTLLPSPLNLLLGDEGSCILPSAFKTEGQAFSSLFLTQLLEGKSIRLPFNVDADTKGNLHKLVETSNEGKDRISGFGFPIFVQKAAEQEENIVAPLFIWEVQLVQKSQEEWMVKSNGTTCIALNNDLLELLEANYPSIHQDLKPFLESDNTLPRQLLDWCASFSEKNNINLPDKPWELSNPTTVNSLGNELPPQAAILDMGVFAPFLEQNCLAIKANVLAQESIDTRPLVETLFQKENTASTQEEVHPYSPFSLNPSQLFVTKALASHQKLNVNGITGEEKTTLIASFICNQILHGKKCLLVAKNKEALQPIRTIFTELGLTPFCLDAVDRSSFTKSLADFSKKVKHDKHEEDRYQLLLKSCNYWLKEVQKERKALNQPLVGELNWKDLVANFLKYDEKGEGELLFPLIDPRRFSFSSEELESLHKSITVCEKFYQPNYVLVHPLSRLHPDVFIEKYYEEAKDFCAQQLRKHKLALIATRKQMIRGLEQYRRNMSLEYDAFYWKAERRVQALLHILTIHLVQFGTTFEKIDALGNTKLKIQGVFSGHKKDLLETRKTINQQYETVKKEHEETQAFPFEFPELSSKFNYASLKEILESYREELLAWQASLPNAIGEETLTLSSAENKPKNTNFLELPLLEEAFEQVIFQLNAVKLFNEPFEEKPFYYHEKINYLDQIANNLEHTERSLADFEGFYAWQKNWCTLNMLSKEVVLALHKARPKHWKTTFKNWYWHQALHRNMDGQLPYGTASLKQFAKTNARLQKHIPSKIVAELNQLRKQKSKTLKKEHKAFWQILNALGGKTAPEDSPSWPLAEEQLATILDFFPICFAIEEDLNAIFPSENPAFDLVLMDEASKEETTLLANKSITFHPSEHSQRFSQLHNSDQLIGEIAKRLSLHIDPKHIQTQVQLTKDFYADLLISTKDKQRKGIVIQCDGMANSGNEGMAKCIQEIEALGYQYLETWSINWWKNADGETKRLLEIFDAID